MAGTLKAILKVISPKTFNRNSQFAHFFAAATIYLTIGIYSRRWVLYLTPVGIALAAWKEFWWDKHKEDADERGSDTQDFSFYMLGLIYAMAILFL